MKMDRIYVERLRDEVARLRNALELSAQAAQIKHGEYEALRAVIIALVAERDTLRAQFAAAQAALADEQTRTEHLIKHAAIEISRKDKLLAECANERAEYARLYVTAAQTTGQWQPVNGGVIAGEQMLFQVEDELSVQTHFEETDWYCVALPDDLRLCRRTTP